MNSSFGLITFSLSDFLANAKNLTMRLVLGFLKGIMTSNVLENVDNKTKRVMCSSFFFSDVWLSVFVRWPYLDLHNEMFANSFCCH